MIKHEVRKDGFHRLVLVLGEAPPATGGTPPVAGAWASVEEPAFVDDRANEGCLWMVWRQVPPGLQRILPADFPICCISADEVAEVERAAP